MVFEDNLARFEYFVACMRFLLNVLRFMLLENSVLIITFIKFKVWGRIYM